MASSGSFNTNAGYSTRYYEFYWEQTSQSIADNSTTIYWKLTPKSGSATWYNYRDLVVYIDGVLVASTGTTVKKGTRDTIIASGTRTIVHNDDGNRSFSASVTLSTYNYGTNNTSGSGSFSLNQIARKSTVSCSGGNIGGATTVSISRKSSSFTHTLTYDFGGLTGTIATKTSSTSVSWTLPDNFYTKIPNAKSGTGTITCTTYSGSTNVGSNTCSFTAKAVESTCKPSISTTIKDTNSTTTALTGDSSKLVKYYSTASVSMSVTANKSSSLSSCSISGAATASGTSSASTSVSSISSNSFTFKATDSRGYTTTVTKTPTMVNYVKLTCSMGDNTPSTSGSMTVTASGNYFNGSFGATNNSLTVQYRYKVSGGTYSSWTDMTITKSGNTYSATKTLTIPDFNYKKTYVFQTRAVDKLITKNSSEKSVKSTPIFDWGENDFVFNVQTVTASDIALLADTGEIVVPKGVTTSSDRAVKENIKYLNYSNINTLAEIDDGITINECLDFVNNDYLLATYNYIYDESKETRISAIAQDLMVNEDESDNKIGLLVTEHREVPVYDYFQGEMIKHLVGINQTQLLNVAIGAIQALSRQVEELRAIIEELDK